MKAAEGSAAGAKLTEESRRTTAPRISSCLVIMTQLPISKSHFREIVRTWKTGSYSKILVPPV
jgi:hypothetical protein